MRMIFYYPLCYLNSSVFVRTECLPTKISFCSRQILWVSCFLARYIVLIRHTHRLYCTGQNSFTQIQCWPRQIYLTYAWICVYWALYLFSVPSNPSSILFILKHVIKVTEQNHHNSFTLSTFIYLFVVRSILIRLMLFL